MRQVPVKCRAGFQPSDYDFIASVLSGGNPSKVETILSLTEDPETLDALLDHERLLAAVVSLESPVEISPQFYFYVLVRHVLKEADIRELELADYVAATLADFASGDSPMRPRKGEAFADVPYHIDFIEALNSASNYEQFYLHVKCGNQFMVLTGLFPRFLERREERRGAPGVRYYEGVAQDSFRAAAIHPLANEFELSEVYLLLADQFPRARLALNRMVREFLWLGK
jgi:hypothetical protein